MEISIPLGVLNALANFAMWLLTSLCLMLSEQIYERLSSRELVISGETRATDSTEISLSSWLFNKHERRVPWWVLLLLLLNFALLPLEMLFETGIDERKSCKPITIRNSSGTCAGPWKGNSQVSLAASALLTQRFQWVDEEWEFVLVGSKKQFDSSEVRLYSRLIDSNRSFVVHNCQVQTDKCGTNCGNMTIQKTDGPFSTIVTNWSGIPRRDGRKLMGDVTWDKSTGMAFLFWEDGSVPDPKRNTFNGSIISVKGMETVMTMGNLMKMARGDKNPWPLLLVDNRTRTYSIKCSTDGLIPWDLARAISLYRTVEMEQPGVRRTGVNGMIEKVPPLNTSDVVKAAFAMKAEDWSGSCSGDIDVYRTCGAFKMHLVFPFLSLAACIIAGWLIIYFTIDKPSAIAPVDARAWRVYALQAMTKTASNELKNKVTMRAGEKGDVLLTRLRTSERFDRNELDAIDAAFSDTSRRVPSNSHR